MEGRKLCPRWGRKPPRFQCCSERERHPSPCSRPHQAQKCLWVGPGEWAHRSAGVPGRVTETRVSANARGDAGKPGSQAGPRGHEATTVRVMESQQARGLAHQFCRASEHRPLQEGLRMRAGTWQRSHPSPLTQSKRLQLLHYLSWGLVGTVTAEFCSAGWSGWAAQLVITHGRDFLQEEESFSCVTDFMDLPWEAVQAQSVLASPQLAPASMKRPQVLTATQLLPPWTPQVYSPQGSSTPAPTRAPQVSPHSSLPPPMDPPSTHFPPMEPPNYSPPHSSLPPPHGTP